MVNSAADPLKDLKDIQLPIEPGWWPLALGWWVLLVMFFCLLTAAIYFYRKKKRSLKTLAYKEWQGFSELSDREKLFQSRALIRRVALQKFAIASGDNSANWQNWLKQQQLDSLFESQLDSPNNIWSKASVDSEFAEQCYQQTGKWIRRLS